MSIPSLDGSSSPWRGKPAPPQPAQRISTVYDFNKIRFLRAAGDIKQSVDEVAKNVAEKPRLRDGPGKTQPWSGELRPTVSPPIALHRYNGLVMINFLPPMPVPLHPRPSLSSTYRSTAWLVQFCPTWTKLLLQVGIDLVQGGPSHPVRNSHDSDRACGRWSGGQRQAPAPPGPCCRREFPARAGGSAARSPPASRRLPSPPEPAAIAGLAA